MKNLSYINYNERIALQPGTFDEKNNTVQGVLTTERPVMVWDMNRWDAIYEILMMDGMINNESKVPLLDAHQRYTTENVLGSVFEFLPGIDSDGTPMILCKNQISSTETKVITKIKEGHLDSTSVGYKVFTSESITLEPGQTVEYAGKVFTNTFDRDLIIRKKWKIMENSIVPIGADDRAKLRASIENEALENRIKDNEQTDDQDIETSEPLQEPSFSSSVRGRILTFLKLKKK